MQQTTHINNHPQGYKPKQMANVTVDVDFIDATIDVEDFLDGCSNKEKNELIKLLAADGRELPKFNEATAALNKIWGQLSVQHEDQIKSIIKQYDATYTGV